MVSSNRLLVLVVALAVTAIAMILLLWPTPEANAFDAELKADAFDELPPDTYDTPRSEGLSMAAEATSSDSAISDIFDDPNGIDPPPLPLTIPHFIHAWTSFYTFSEYI
jgi:hypothetical protein